MKHIIAIFLAICALIVLVALGTWIWVGLPQDLEISKDAVAHYQAKVDEKNRLDNCYEPGVMAGLKNSTRVHFIKNKKENDIAAFTDKYSGITVDMSDSALIGPLAQLGPENNGILDGEYSNDDRFIAISFSMAKLKHMQNVSCDYLDKLDSINETEFVHFVGSGLSLDKTEASMLNMIKTNLKITDLMIRGYKKINDNLYYKTGNSSYLIDSFEFDTNKGIVVYSVAKSYKRGYLIAIKSVYTKSYVVEAMKDGVAKDSPIYHSDYVTFMITSTVDALNLRVEK